MARLPVSGGDQNVWGDVLNQFLLVAHNPDGTLRAIDSSLIPELATKAPINSPTFTGVVTVPTPVNSTDAVTKAYVDAGTGFTPDATNLIKGKVQLSGDLSGTAAAPTVPGLTTKEPIITAGTTSQYWRGDKSWQTLDKTTIGLANVDNTADTNKPISTATQTALNAKANDTAVVHLAGTETITGAKTFSVSPTVPAPVANGDAANKQYVDSSKILPLSVPYTPTITPDIATTTVLTVSVLTGNITINAPTGTPIDSQNLRFRFRQDATGSRAITFDPAYVFGTDITQALIPTAANEGWEMLFSYSAADGTWRATAIARGF